MYPSLRSPAPSLHDTASLTSLLELEPNSVFFVTTHNLNLVVNDLAPDHAVVAPENAVRLAPAPSPH
ncbi:hypothetical protein glysoja_047373 [Glycine soja]|uniref:Uncharacterized protein n=1 Tax=Glycine soja TaxID=3848 RepID=A0A0B2PCG4_GLYSO|nr:hypothetical protein glysoja_047373 [Glycine soja]